MEQQLRRYFIGVISFGFIVTWMAVGIVTAFLGLLCAFATTTVVPALLDTRRAHQRTKHRRVAPPRARSVTTRPLDAEELPLVPDEPSLIITASS